MVRQTIKTTSFFTVGVGVTEGEGYDYISQVLHPMAQNLERCKNSKDPRANELHKALTKQYADNTKITVGSKKIREFRQKVPRIITPIHTAIMIMPTTAKWQKMMQWTAKHWRKSLSSFCRKAWK